MRFRWSIFYLIGFIACVVIISPPIDNRQSNMLWHSSALSANISLTKKIHFVKRKMQNKVIFSL